MPAHDEARPWVSALDDLSAGQGDGYAEFLRVPAMSMGLFTASKGYDDQQQPHREDEVYLVTSGRAVLEIDGEPHPVAAGSIAFVPARVRHRFTDITDDLRVLVFFAPAES